MAGHRIGHSLLRRRLRRIELIVVFRVCEAPGSGEKLPGLQLRQTSLHAVISSPTVPTSCWAILAVGEIAGMQITYKGEGTGGGRHSETSARMAIHTSSCQKHFLQDHPYGKSTAPSVAPLRALSLGGVPTPGCVALRASSPGVTFVWRFAPL